MWSTSGEEAGSFVRICCFSVWKNKSFNGSAIQWYHSFPFVIHLPIDLPNEMITYWVIAELVQLSVMFPRILQEEWKNRAATQWYFPECFVFHSFKPSCSRRDSSVLIAFDEAFFCLLLVLTYCFINLCKLSVSWRYPVTSSSPVACVLYEKAPLYFCG